MPQLKQKLHCFWVLLFVMHVACSQNNSLFKDITRMWLHHSSQS